MFCGYEFQGVFVWSRGGLDEDSSTGHGDIGTMEMGTGGRGESQVGSPASGTEGWWK